MILSCEEAGAGTVGCVQSAIGYICSWRLCKICSGRLQLTVTQLSQCRLQAAWPSVSFSIYQVCVAFISPAVASVHWPPEGFSADFGVIVIWFKALSWFGSSVSQSLWSSGCSWVLAGDWQQSGSRCQELSLSSARELPAGRSELTLKQSLMIGQVFLSLSVDVLAISITAVEDRVTKESKEHLRLFTLPSHLY